MDCGDTDAPLEAISAWLGEQGFLSWLAAVGHRLIYGSLDTRTHSRKTVQC